MTKLAIVTTHPIQYNDPWFRLLAKLTGIQLRVYYTWGQTQSGAKFDPGFGRVVEWDIPLLQDYDYVFVKNISPAPGTHHFKGIINPTLIQEINDWHPDALLVIGWSFKSHLQCIRYFHKKIPILFRGDSTILNEQRGFKQIARRIFLTWVYRHIDIALYVGINNRNYFKRHGLSDKQLIFAPHAVDNMRFGKDSDINNLAAVEWRRKLGIADSDFVILFAGKVENIKNPFFLVRLSERLKDKNIKFLVVGNGVLEEKLKNETKNDNRFIFLDFQNQQIMPVIYRMGDIFILCSMSETWGLAVNEAMACGRPVLVTDRVGCAVDLVHEEKNGMILKNFDVEACSQFVSRLNHERNSAKAMGLYSANLIRDFTFDKIAQAVMKALQQFIKQPT